MFREAYAKAKHYTRPVIGAARRVDGKCTSGIASFVVVNREGWIYCISYPEDAYGRAGKPDKNASLF